MKQSKEMRAYENGKIDGYFHALEFFIKAYRGSMAQIEREWKALRAEHKHDSPPGWNKP